MLYRPWACVYYHSISHAFPSCSQVITNGYLSLGSRYIDFTPRRFPADDFIIAPFWSDVDIRSVGDISYEIHTSSTAAMSLVSTFISQRQQIDFTGTWMLIAYWNNVPRFGRSTSNVSHLKSFMCIHSLIIKGIKPYQKTAVQELNCWRFKF